MSSWIPPAFSLCGTPPTTTTSGPSVSSLILRVSDGDFLTSDYILDETVTLLLVRHSHAAASDFLHTITASESLRLEWVDSDRFHTAAEFFTGHGDKEWSFTDCVSFALMHDLKIEDSFTTDHHFRQAGFKPLLAKPD